MIKKRRQEAIKFHKMKSALKEAVLLYPVVWVYFSIFNL